MRTVSRKVSKAVPVQVVFSGEDKKALFSLVDSTEPDDDDDDDD
jgi:hypothetical protein